MAREGLRTLVVARKMLTEEQYADFEVCRVYVASMSEFLHFSQWVKCVGDLTKPRETVTVYLDRCEALYSLRLLIVTVLYCVIGNYFSFLQTYHSLFVPATLEESVKRVICVHSLIIPVASSEKCNVMVCSSICLSVPLAYKPWLIRGQHVMQLAYISAEQWGPKNVFDGITTYTFSGELRLPSCHPISVLNLFVFLIYQLRVSGWTLYTSGVEIIVVVEKSLTWLLQSRYHQAKMSVQERAMKVAAVVESLERDMELLCVTGVEDKLHDGVRTTLELLRNAGIKVLSTALSVTEHLLLGLH